MKTTAEFEQQLRIEHEKLDAITNKIRRIVTINTIVDALMDAHLLMDAKYSLEAIVYKDIAERIKNHGIAPPDGYVLLPVNTLEQWSALLSENRYRRPLWEIDTMLEASKDKP